MPVVPAALAQLLETNIDANMSSLGGKPLGQDDPSYFKALCLAIATGVAAQATIAFNTVDSGQTSAPPIPGAGVGVGIIVDDMFLSEQIYTNMRNQTISQFGKSTHSAWPPPSGDTGEFLKALTDGIAISIKTHFTTCWTLTSVHPLVYAGAGNVIDGGFSGVDDSAMAAAMTGAAPSLAGPYAPTMFTQIAKSIKLGIETMSTATVTITGICIPSPGQVCGISLPVGSGSGVAS